MLKWLAAKFGKQGVRIEARHGSSADPDPNRGTAGDSAAWRKRGNAFLDDNNLPEAEQCYRKGMQADPADAICYSNLGFVLVQMGRSAEAEPVLDQAVKRDPADFDAYYLLGTVAQARGENVRAIACFRMALRSKPDFDFCRRALCILLAQTGQPQEAKFVMDQGPTFDHDSVDFHLFKGNMQLAVGEYDAAVVSFQQARQLKPLDATILINLGAAQIGKRDILTALDTYNTVLEFDPNNVPAHANVAAAYQLGGQLELAVQSYRRALQVNPQYLYAHQNLLFVLSHMSSCSATDYLAEAQNYGSKVRAVAKPFSQWLCQPRPPSARPLRVGFVSGDLRGHPVGYFLEAILARLDRSRVVCVAYSNSATEDAHAVRLKKLFSEWRKVVSMPDEDLARQIHADQIDILVDLAGHTGHNRLSVFAWRPAPRQVSWLGYWASTGVSEMDYILVDNVSVQPAEESSYSEKPWYLPDTRLCLSVPNAASSIGANALPALSQGYVTFGSFQTLSKIGDATLSLWAQVLARMPSARLRLQSLPLGFPNTLADMKERLDAAHIDLRRVDMFGGTSRDAYLAAYGEVDLVLDTFPFPGGTTTAEALWMGVPTVTLTGNTLLARQGESMLRCVGLADWVASTEQEYIQLALDKAADLHALARLRAGLRSTALASPLFDGARFAKNLEAAFEGMAKEAGSRSN